MIDGWLLGLIEGSLLGWFIDAIIKLEGWLEGSLLGWLLGSDDGSFDRLGPNDGCDVGQSLTEGLAEPRTLGIPDTEGLKDGCALG